MAIPTRSASGSVVHKVCADFLGKVHTFFQSLEDLGVGIRAGGEIAVGILLFGNDGDVGDAHILEDTGDRDETCAVQRRDQLERGFVVLQRPGRTLACLDRFIQSILATRRRI